MTKILFGLMLTGGIVAASSGVALAQTKLILDKYLPATHPLVTGFMEPFKADVARATNGRVVIELSDSPLSSSSKQWEAVESGISDIAVQYTGWYRSRIQLPAIAHLPFMIPSAAGASVALWRTYDKMFGQANEFKGMKVLGFATHTGNQIANNKHAITSLASLDGLKIRASAGEPTQVARLLGATPVTTSGPKIFEFVSKGVVDGLMDGMHAPLAFRVIRYIKHVTDIPGTLGAISFAVYMNEKKWNALSKADQVAIMSVAGEKLSRRAGEAFDTFTAKSISELKSAGATMDRPSPQFQAELEARLQSVQEAWIKEAATRNVDGKAAIAYFRQQLPK